MQWVLQPYYKAAYHIHGWKRENTTLPQPTGNGETNKQRLPFLEHNIFLEKHFRVNKDGHILGPEWLGSGSDIKQCIIPEAT
jgi:hypothetical protein